MAVRAIFFDCYGVLVTEIYGRIAREHPEHRDDIKRITTDGDLGKIHSAKVADGVKRTLSEGGLDGEEIVDGVIGGTQKNYELLAVIKELRQKYKTGIISNAGAHFWNMFSREEIDEYFDEVVLSYEWGIIKPDRRIFEIAAERLGVEAGECVFVDDKERNVRAAEGCGMKGIVYEWGMDMGEALRVVGVDL